MKTGPKFDEALAYASRIHRGQLRKATRIPYISHLLAVTAIALEHGANETEAIGAVLHDAAEDAGGLRRIAAIKRKFGPRVAAIVAGCSDTFKKRKPAWKPRKTAYLAHLAKAPASVQLVSASDIGAYPGKMVFATPHTTVAIEAFVMDPGMVTLRRLQVDHLLNGFKEPRLTLTASAAGFQLGSVRGPVREYRDIPVTGLPEWIEAPVLIASTRQGRGGATG